MREYQRKLDLKYNQLCEKNAKIQLIFSHFQQIMAVNDQEDSDFEGSGDWSDSDYEGSGYEGSGNGCGYVGDDEDYDDEGSGMYLTI